MASSKLVLPWSTWPITVTTGGRGLRLSLVSSLATSRTISSSSETTLTTPLNASASVVAVGTSSAWLMLANTPRSSKVFSNSLARTSSFSAGSRMVMPSVMATSRGARGSGGATTAAAERRSPNPGRCRVGCNLRSPSCSRLSRPGRCREVGLRVYSGLPGSAFDGAFASGIGGSIPGRPGARGPGRVPVGSAPRRCSKGRLGGPTAPPGPVGRGEYVRPVPPGPPPDCCGRIGCPGRGPLGREPGVVPGTGPRLPEGKGPRFPVGRGGRAGAAGRAPAAPGAAAAGRAPTGCAPERTGGEPGRDGACAPGRIPGCAGAAGRTGAGAVAVVDACGAAGGCPVAGRTDRNGAAVSVAAADCGAPDKLGAAGEGGFGAACGVATVAGA